MGRLPTQTGKPAEDPDVLYLEWALLPATGVFDVVRIRFMMTTTPKWTTEALAREGVEIVVLWGEWGQSLKIEFHPWLVISSQGISKS